jgi:hypothetical protein
MAAISAGCATVRFYEDAELTKETGLQYYQAKPYLLVAKTGAKDKPVEVHLVYLPDLSQPRYAQYDPGLGTHEFTLTLSNGMLASYGQKADSKVPETIQSVGSLATSLATAATTAGLVPQALDFAGRKQAAADLDSVASQLAAEVAQAEVAKALTAIQKQAAKGIEEKLRAAAKILADPSDEAPAAAKILREDVIAKLDALKVVAPGNIDPVIQFNGKLDTWKKEVEAIVSAVDAPPQAEPFQLYEIRQSGGATRLVPVSVDALRR